MDTYNRQNTPASEMPPRLLRVPVWLWFRLVRQLRRRGQGRRESGAFLLGTRHKDQDVVRTFACYDDLEPHALDQGIITFAPSGYAALWSICRRQQFEVLADIHTHPGGRPQQSESDRTNPMISKTGHIAFIMPHFAKTWGWNFNEVAIGEYRGNYLWNDWSGPQRRERVRFRWW
jgi:proteasome lid subunit RPN8/RPN11